MTTKRNNHAAWAAIHLDAPALAPAADVVVFKTAPRPADVPAVIMGAWVRSAIGNRRHSRATVPMPASLEQRVRGAVLGPWSSAVSALALWALDELDRQGVQLAIREPVGAAGERNSVERVVGHANSVARAVRAQSSKKSRRGR